MKVVKVTQDGCKPCKDLEFLMENMELVADEVINLTTAGQNQKDYALNDLGVMGTPQLFLIDDEGEVIRNTVGASNIASIQELFDIRDGN